MSKVILALLAGLILTILSLLILPKDTVTIGPSCPICDDVNGGRYHHKQYGWPFRFLYRDDTQIGDEQGIINGIESKKTGKILQLLADVTVWSAISGAGIFLVQNTRHK